MGHPLSLPGQKEEEHRVVLQVQVEHYQKKSQDHKPKSKIPGLVPVDYESGSLFAVFDLT